FGGAKTLACPLKGCTANACYNVVTTDPAPPARAAYNLRPIRLQLTRPCPVNLLTRGKPAQRFFLGTVKLDRGAAQVGRRQDLSPLIRRVKRLPPPASDFSNNVRSDLRWGSIHSSLAAGSPARGLQPVVFSDLVDDGIGGALYHASATAHADVWVHKKHL